MRSPPSKPTSTGVPPSLTTVTSSERSSRADTTRPTRVSRVQIDFDRIHQRIIAIPGLAQRNYAQLRPGLPGTVFFTETVAPTGTAEDGPPPGAVLHRYQLKDRKAASFAQNIAQYVVSADGKKLLYRTPGAQGALFAAGTILALVVLFANTWLAGRLMPAPTGRGGSFSAWAALSCSPPPPGATTSCRRSPGAS